MHRIYPTSLYNISRVLALPPCIRGKALACVLELFLLCCALPCVSLRDQVAYWNFIVDEQHIFAEDPTIEHAKPPKGGVPTGN